MRAPYDYGISQEDERTEAAALGLPGGRVLSIASGGDMALSLLALGADEVVALDVASSQLHLARLKLTAATELEREDAVRFLGFLPAPPGRRRAWLATLLDRLPPDTREFWAARAGAARDGPIWAGRYERHVRRLRTAVRPFAGRAFEELCACRTLDEQAAVFARRFDTRLLRSAFRLAFTPRVYAGAGIARVGLRHRDDRTSLGLRFFERFRAMCVASPAGDNHLLQLHLLGRVRDAGVVPEYLTESGVRRLRERRGSIAFVHASLLPFLESGAARRFDRFHLSNVPDWLSAAEFERVLELIAGSCARPARLVWRHLHRDHAVAGEIRRDDALGDELRARDRFPFYAVVPASIGDAAPSGGPRHAG